MVYDSDVSTLWDADGMEPVVAKMLRRWQAATHSELTKDAVAGAVEARCFPPASTVFRGKGGATWTGFDDGPSADYVRRIPAECRNSFWDGRTVANDNAPVNIPRRHAWPARDLARAGVNGGSGLLGSVTADFATYCLLRLLRSISERAADFRPIAERDTTGRQDSRSLKAPSADAILRAWSANYDDELDVLPPSGPARDSARAILARMGKDHAPGRPVVFANDTQVDGGRWWLQRVGGLRFGRDGAVTHSKTARGWRPIAEEYGDPRGEAKVMPHRRDPADTGLYRSAALPRNGFVRVAGKLVFRPAGSNSPRLDELDVTFLAGKVGPSHDRNPEGVKSGPRPVSSPFDPAEAAAAEANAQAYAGEVEDLRRAILTPEQEAAVMGAVMGAAFDEIGGEAGKKQSQRRGLALVRDAIGALLNANFLDITRKVEKFDVPTEILSEKTMMMSQESPFGGVYIEKAA